RSRPRPRPDAAHAARRPARRYAPRRLPPTSRLQAAPPGGPLFNRRHWSTFRPALTRVTGRPRRRGHSVSRKTNRRWRIASSTTACGYGASVERATRSRNRVVQTKNDDRPTRPDRIEAGTGQYPSDVGEAGPRSPSSYRRGTRLKGALDDGSETIADSPHRTLA